MNWRMPQLLVHQSLNVPGKVMDAVGSSENGGSSGGESEANQSLSGNVQGCLSCGRYFYDATSAGEGCRDIKITVDVEGQPLRTSEAAIEGRDISLRIDLVHAVEA